MSVSMSDLVQAIEKMNDRLLKAEAQNMVLKKQVRKILLMDFAANDGLREAWDVGLDADRTEWKKALATAEDNPTRKFFVAGLAELDDYQSKSIGVVEPLRVIDGGKAD